jgi:hypothetical protein
MDLFQVMIRTAKQGLQFVPAPGGSGIVDFPEDGVFVLRMEYGKVVVSGSVDLHVPFFTG